MLPVEEKIIETKEKNKENSFDAAFEALGLNGEFINAREINVPVKSPITPSSSEEKEEQTPSPTHKS